MQDSQALSKSELIQKLQEISAAFKKTLAITKEMKEFQPEDNYKRTVAIPQFPGKYPNEQVRQSWMDAVEHEDEDAVEQMDAVYEKTCYPARPSAPVHEKFQEPNNSHSEGNQAKYGCLSNIAAVIGIFFLLGIPSSFDAPESLPTMLIIIGIAAAAFLFFRGKVKKEKAEMTRKIAQAQTEYNERQAAIQADYKARLKAYEEKCESIRPSKEAFLKEYRAWREIYLAHLAEEARIEEQLEKDRLAGQKKIYAEEYTPAQDYLESCNSLLTEKYLPAADVLIDLLRSGRADDLKEAINLLEDMLYRERQLELQREQEQQRQREEALKQEAEERRYQEQMAFQRQQEYQRRAEEQQRRNDEERRHQEDMKQREQQEQARLKEEKRQRDAERSRQACAEVDRKREERDATRRQCNTCALNARCSMAFQRANCASYKPR